MLGDVNKLFVFKTLLTTPSNILPLHLKQIFLLIIWIFIEGEGDGIKSRLHFKMFSTLLINSGDIIRAPNWLNPSIIFWGIMIRKVDGFSYQVRFLKWLVILENMSRRKISTTQLSTKHNLQIFTPWQSIFEIRTF